jgi:ribonuclease Z
LNHRVACCGFLFREKATLPHIRRDMIDYLEIPVSQINNIKNGAGWVKENGDVVPHEELVTPADPARSYAFCSDTKYMPRLAEMVKGVDLLYHESTYCNEQADRAKLYYHSTAEQAAMVAKAAGAGRLLLGHYSARYEDEQVMLNEARAVFPETYLTAENDVFEL